MFAQMDSEAKSTSTHPQKLVQTTKKRCCDVQQEISLLMIYLVSLFLFWCLLSLRPEDKFSFLISK